VVHRIKGEATMKVARRIGVLAHAGNQNLGDEALMASVVQNVRRRLPEAAVYGFTVNPRDTEERHGIPAFPIRRVAAPPKVSGRPAADLSMISALTSRLTQATRKVAPLHRVLQAMRTGLRFAANVPRELWFLVGSYRRLKGIDLLLVAGSQQLNDHFRGPGGFPYTLFKWSVLAKLVGAPVAFLSVGAGPINSRLSRLLFRGALSLAAYRSYRDASSRTLAQTMGIIRDDPVVPDLVYSLRFNAPATCGAGGAAPLVGANPVPFYDGRYWPEDNPVTYQRYVRTLAVLGDWLVRGGRRVVFFPTQLRADPLVIHDIRRLMTANGDGGTGRVVPGAAIGSLQDLVNEIARMDIVIANRYHGILIALLLNKPVLGLAYHQKSMELMTMMGQARYAIDISHCNPELLIERFSVLEAEAAEVKREISERATALREALERQYDRVFGLLDGKPATLS
jgi:polysaccharide pyruvyl transferase WcaK-like protein